MGAKWSSPIWKEVYDANKATYSLHCDNFVSRGLQRTIRNTGKTVPLYHRGLLGKRPSEDTVCTPPVIQGLKQEYKKRGSGQRLTVTVTTCPAVFIHVRMPQNYMTHLWCPVDTSHHFLQWLFMLCLCSVTCWSVRYVELQLVEHIHT